MFELNKLTVSFEDRRLFGPLELELASTGDALVIQGSSGCGKSTLLRVLGALRHPSSGSVSFRGRELKANELLQHRRRVHLIPQQPPLPGASLREVLNMGRELHGLEPTPDEDLGKALESLGLGTLEPGQGLKGLSGGESMRVALLRGLLLPVECLLLDEPTTGLDDRSVEALLDVFERAETPPIVSASHDPRWIEFCDTRYELAGGGLHAR